MGFPKGKDKTGEYSKQPSNGVKIPTPLLIEALRKTRGNISRAADKLKICRQTLHSRINKEPELKEVVEEYRERFLDDLEDVFQNKALSGDTISCMFLLKTLGKKRGYDQDRDVVVEGAARAAIDFVMNRTKNPAE